MKRIKAIIAIMLSFMMMFSVAMNEKAGAKEVRADVQFAITSPTNASMRGAGYITIKWTSASPYGTVKDYKLYVDGALVATTQSLSYEIYTIKVNYHNAWVVADFADGTAISTTTVRFGVTKKGLAVNAAMGQNLRTSDIHAGWYYNWGTTPFTYSGYSSLEYVPMIWGQGSFNTNINNAKNADSSYVLGFNEPDFTNQANMSVDQAISLWSSIMNTGKKVGSPATGTWPSNNTNWFQPFMTKINSDGNLNVDFVAIHCYPDDWNGGKSMADWFLSEVVDKAWEMYRKPIWVTEFSTSGNGITEAGTASFLENVMPGLESRDYVERYSFFSFNRSTFAGGLWWYANGALSSAGEVYAQYGNPTSDYQAGTAVNNYKHSSDIVIKNTQNQNANQNTNQNVSTINVKKPDKVKIKSAKNLKGKKIKLTWKKISGAKGYQIKYSDSKKFNGSWIKSTKKTSYTIRKLDKNTKYYITVRAFVNNV